MKNPLRPLLSACLQVTPWEGPGCWRGGDACAKRSMVVDDKGTSTHQRSSRAARRKAFGCFLSFPATCFQIGSPAAFRESVDWVLPKPWWALESVKELIVADPTGRRTTRSDLRYRIWWLLGAALAFFREPRRLGVTKTVVDSGVYEGGVRCGGSHRSSRYERVSYSIAPKGCWWVALVQVVALESRRRGSSRHRLVRWVERRGWRHVSTPLQAD